MGGLHDVGRPLAAVATVRSTSVFRIVAQLTNSRTMETTFDESPFIDNVLVEGPGRSQYASFTFEDLNAIAPWLEAKQIIGPSLGHGD